MIQIFAIMMFLGAFCFLSFGLCSANSIESKNSKKIQNILTFLSVLGLLSFIIGVIGAFWVNCL
jgi:hypothetical protein